MGGRYDDAIERQLAAIRARHREDVKAWLANAIRQQERYAEAKRKLEAWRERQKAARQRRKDVYKLREEGLCYREIGERIGVTPARARDICLHRERDLRQQAKCREFKEELKEARRQAVTNFIDSIYADYYKGDVVTR